MSHTMLAQSLLLLESALYPDTIPHFPGHLPEKEIRYHMFRSETERLQMIIMSSLLQRRETNTEVISVYQQNSVLTIQLSVSADNPAVI